jgi:NADH dehydrogenase [ubiquinone] 1 alpha subcomplex assembly factor 7
MGKPDAYQMAEFGPGRGTLMADMVYFALNHNDKLQEYGNALKVVHFIEGSEPLRQQQEAALREQVGTLVNLEFHNPNHKDDNNNNNNNNNNTTAVDPSKPTIRVYWHDSFASLSTMIMRQKQQRSESGAVDPADVSSMPLLVVCQEFFDALPVHAFEMTNDGWRERMVDVAIQDELLQDDDDKDSNDNDNAYPKTASTGNINVGNKKRPRLRIVLAPEVTPALKTLMNVDDEGKTLNAMTSDKSLQVGDIVEVCPEGILLVQDIASLLDQQGGAALLIDYGEEGSTDSLRGFWKHEQAHFLSLPGDVDVTADVDFTALKHAVNHSRRDRLQQQQPVAEVIDNDKENNIRAYGPIHQGKFLVAMGARERVIHSIESDSTTDEQAEDLFHALERLVAPEQMGVRYKVLSIAPERKDRNASFTVPPAGF